MLLFVTAFAVAIAACGDTGAGQPTAISLGGAPTTTEAPTATSAPGAPTTTSANDGAPQATEPSDTVASRQRPEGPDAPDFELALGGPGGTFVLSEETRPVFMVFWAEW